MKIAVLDEFGHDGIYISRNDRNYSASPVFGYAGFVIPTIRIFTFINGFVDIKGRTPQCAVNTMSPIATELKGVQIFQRDTFSLSRPSEKRRNSERLATALLDLVKSSDGRILYYGLEKFACTVDQHNAKGMHIAVLKQCLRISERYCENQGTRFVMLLDEHSAHKERQSAVADAIYAKYLDRWWLAEPPIEAASYFCNLIQAADWLAAIIGRIWAYRTRQKEWADVRTYHDIFGESIRAIAIDGSTVRPPPRFRDDQ